MRNNSYKEIKPGETYVNNSGDEYTITAVTSSNNIAIRYNDLHQYECITTAKHIREGRLKNPYAPSVHVVGYMGVGPYVASINRTKTLEYHIWSGILERCYSANRSVNHQTYLNCRVCNEWHNFQIFAHWYVTHPDYGKGYDIDKDVMVPGNTLYSPSTCCMLPSVINKALVGRHDTRELPTGVYYNTNKTRYVVKLRKNNEMIHGGTYDDPILAGQIYHALKSEYLSELANAWREHIQPDVYFKLINWSNR